MEDALQILQKAKEKNERIERQIIEANTKKQQYAEQLKEMGFATTSDAQQAIAKIEQDNITLSAEIEQDIKKLNAFIAE